MSIDCFTIVNLGNLQFLSVYSCFLIGLCSFKFQRYFDCILIAFCCSIERRVEPGMKPRIPDNAESLDCSKGFRSISTSPDGHYLAAGDRSGNLYVYDLHSLQIITHKVSFLAHRAKVKFACFN